MRTILLLITLVLVLKISSGSSGNITQFDDGGDNFNMTANATKYITIPVNSSVSLSNISLRGQRLLNVTDGWDVSSSTVLQIQDISLIPGTDHFYAVDKSDKLYRLNSTGGWLSNITLHDDCGINFIFPATSQHTYYGVSAVDNDTVYVLNYDSGDVFHYLNKVNYSKGLNLTNSCEDYYNISAIDTPQGLFVSSDMNHAYVSHDIIGTTYIYKFNITFCITDIFCRTSENFTMSSYASDRAYVALDSTNDGTNLFAINDVTKRLYYLDTDHTETEFHSTNLDSILDASTLSDVRGIAVNGTDVWLPDMGSTDEIAKLTLRYPADVVINMNNTEIFNNVGDLTGDNISINLSNSEIESYLTSNGQVPIEIKSGTWGKLEVLGINVKYNKSNIAVLTITSPSQITASITSGDSYTQAVIIENSGNWNLTNMNFETVSGSGTPNYNDSISYSCPENQINASSSISCNVTFTSLTQNPEDDEKLKLYGTGSDEGETVFSNGVDVDITVSEQTQSGGGGGAASGYNRCNWKIHRPQNKVWTGLGWEGYQTRPQKIQIYNNETNKMSFSFRAEGLNECSFSKQNLEIEGASFGVTTVVCAYPVEKDTGKIIVTGGGCDSSISVSFVSNQAGRILLFITGGMGVPLALGFWGLIVGGIVFITRL